MQHATNVSQWPLKMCFPELQELTLILPALKHFGNSLSELADLHYLELNCPECVGLYDDMPQEIDTVVIHRAQGTIVTFRDDLETRKCILKTTLSTNYFAGLVCCNSCVQLREMPSVKLQPVMFCKIHLHVNVLQESAEPWQLRDAPMLVSMLDRLRILSIPDHCATML